MLVGDVMLLDRSFTTSKDDILILPGACQYGNPSWLPETTKFIGSTGWLFDKVFGITDIEQCKKEFSGFGRYTTHRFDTKLLPPQPNAAYIGPAIGLCATHLNPHQLFTYSKGLDDVNELVHNIIATMLKWRAGQAGWYNQPTATIENIESVGIGPLFWDPYFNMPGTSRLDILNRLFMEFNRYKFPFDVNIYGKI